MNTGLKHMKHKQKKKWMWLLQHHTKIVWSGAVEAALFCVWCSVWGPVLFVSSTWMMRLFKDICHHSAASSEQTLWELNIYFLHINADTVELMTKTRNVSLELSWSSFWVLNSSWIVCWNLTCVFLRCFTSLLKNKLLPEVSELWLAVRFCCIVRVNRTAAADLSTDQFFASGYRQQEAAAPKRWICRPIFFLCRMFSVQLSLEISLVWFHDCFRHLNAVLHVCE